MDYQQAKQEVKGHLEELLQQQGITNTRKPFRCLNPAHEDRNPSMSYDPKTQRANCFSGACGVSYDAIDVLGLAHGYTDEHGIDGRHFNEVLREACERFNIPLDSSPSSTGTKTQKPKPQPTTAQADTQQQKKAEKARRQIQEARKHLEDPEALAYLQKRGLSLETAKKHGLGYLPRFYSSDGNTWGALIIPTSETGFLARRTDEGEGRKKDKRGKVEPFNLKAIYEAETVHLTEGEIDALSVCEVGGAAIGLGSASYVNIFLDRLKQALVSPSKPLKVKTLILSLDNDISGLSAAQKVRDGINDLKERKLTDIRLKTIPIAQNYKDPNAALTADREAFTEAVKKRATEEEIEAYAETSAASRLMDFYEGVYGAANTDPIPTGFRLLDAELDGGLREGLVVIPAITSLGKTTFALQVMENVAAQGKDVLYITLEMSASELIAKSLSRHTFLIAAREGQPREYAKTVRGITDGKRYDHYSPEERALIMQAYEAYNAYAGHIYIREGLGDITAKDVRKMVQQHRDMTGQTPLLCLDYVQILQPLNPHASDKQNLDAATLELKRISRDYKTPVVILSSLNRMNYDQPINLAAMKESGALEYTADLVLGLQLQNAGSSRAQSDKEWINDRMKEDPRRLEVKVLKNRNGRRGESLYFDYYSLFNCFDEQEYPARLDYEPED